MSPGEDVPDAAKREMTEELGISDVKLDFLYTHLFSDHTESELVSSFSCVYNGEINFDPEEIEEVAFWDFGRIRESLGKDVFSKHFEEEIATYVRLKGPISG